MTTARALLIVGLLAGCSDDAAKAPTDAAPIPILDLDGGSSAPVPDAAGLFLVDGALPAPVSSADAALPPAFTAGPLATQQTIAVLAVSGASGTPPAGMPVLADAQEPSESGLTSPLHVTGPGANCPRLMHLFNPAIAIPTNSTIREISATFNGTPLTLLDEGMTELTETPHSYGEQIPFFRPLFSLDGVTPGKGSLVVTGYDSSHTMVGSQTIPNVEVVAPPPPLAPCQITAAHPRIWLTPERLAVAQQRPMTDPAAKRFWSATDGVQYFLNALKTSPDPTQCSFGNAAYDPISYIPALALCYQLDKTSDNATAMKCAGAAKALALDLLTKYENNGMACDGTALTFDRDDGYDIRFSLMYLMIAYRLAVRSVCSGDDRARLVKLATEWIDCYHANGLRRESLPTKIITPAICRDSRLAALATAGDNDRLAAPPRSVERKTLLGGADPQPADLRRRLARGLELRPLLGAGIWR